MIINYLNKILLIAILPIMLFGQNIPRQEGASNHNELLTMEFVEADLIPVLRMIAMQNNINLILNDNISGTVTVHFVKVTLQSALDAILKVNGYDYYLQENILIVKAIDSEFVGETETRVITLDYVSAADIQVPMEDVLTSKGSMQVFSRTSHITDQNVGGDTEATANILVITDVKWNFVNIESIIEQLDIPLPQVMITVKFIETSITDNTSLGIDWTSKARLTGGPVATDLTTGLPKAVGTTTGLGLGKLAGLANVNLAILNFTEFQMVLEYLEIKGQSKLLSNPRMTTLDGQRAHFETETQMTVIVPTVSAGATGAIATQQAQKITIEISLDVLPKVHKNGTISMAVEPTVEAITGYSGDNLDQPIISRRSAATQIRVNNGETIAIGGLMMEDIRNTETRVPYLGSLPIFGKLLFTSVKKEIVKSDLMIFITPHIVYDDRSLN